MCKFKAEPAVLRKSSLLLYWPWSEFEELTFHYPRGTGKGARGLDM